MSTGKILATGFRLGLTIVLVILVWKNSHWSVALSVTLLAVTVECFNWTLELILQQLRSIRERL